MRDRLARAIHKSMYGSDVMWKESVATADAVLDELMTPTHEMIMNGSVVADSFKMGPLSVISLFTAMIKAAKEGK